MEAGPKQHERPTPDQFFADVPEVLDEHARAIVRDLRSLLARVNVAYAQPCHTHVLPPDQDVKGYLELKVVHPSGDPHLTVSYRPDDIYVFWTGGYVREPAWRPAHLLVLECVLTGRNNIEVRRRRARILSTMSEFWSASGERFDPIETETPRPRLRGRLHVLRARWRRGSSTTTYHQVSFERAVPLPAQLEPFKPSCKNEAGAA